MGIPGTAPALVVTRNGGREVLAVEDRPVAEPGPGELLVEVAGAGVNFIDVYQREGAYPVPTPFVVGQEGAGRVVAVGPQTTGFTVGDRVAWATTLGTTARYAVLPAARVVPVPDQVPDRLAAALLLQGLTAHYLVTSTYAVQPGDTCVVHAAAGGVGQLLVQLVRARGGRVVATAGGPAKVAIAEALGAEVVIDNRANTDLATELRAAVGDPGAAVAYDGVGAATFDASLTSLRRRGLLALFGAASGPVPPFDLQRLNRGGSLYVTRPSLADYVTTTEELRWRAGELFAAVADGSLRVAEPTAYPLDDAASAYESLETRNSTGKLLIIP